MSSSESYLCVVDLKRLEQHLAETGQPAYRAGQVWEWTARGVEGSDVLDRGREGVDRVVRAVRLELVGRDTSEQSDLL